MSRRTSRIELTALASSLLLAAGVTDAQPDLSGMWSDPPPRAEIFPYDARVTPDE